MSKRLGKGKGRNYPVPMRHQNDQGKPTMDRGKPPHKGGYSGRKKGINFAKVYFEVSDPLTTKVKRVPSSWNPGKSR
jgi:hypothetical protein